MDRSGAGGGAYLLNSNVSIRSGKRKHLLSIAKNEQKTRDAAKQGPWAQAHSSQLGSGDDRSIREARNKMP
jgi:hypothetical protein